MNTVAERTYLQKEKWWRKRSGHGYGWDTKFRDWATDTLSLSSRPLTFFYHAFLHRLVVYITSTLN